MCPIRFPLRFLEFYPDFKTSVDDSKCIELGKMQQMVKLKPKSRILLWPTMSSVRFVRCWIPDGIWVRWVLGLVQRSRSVW